MAAATTPTCAGWAATGSTWPGGSWPPTASARRSRRTSPRPSSSPTRSSTRTSGSSCEAYIAAAGIEVGEDDREWPSFEPPAIEALDLAAAGIGTVLWTTGYRPDYGWLDFPVLDEFGVPRHVRGVTEVPGLTMIGALWQHNNGSANLIGVHLDAAYLASRW